MSSLGELQSRFQQAVLAEEDSPGLFLAEGGEVAGGLGPVSYTHLDVYKRQSSSWPLALSA